MAKTWQDYPRRVDLKGIPAMTAKGWETVFDNADKEVARTNPNNPPIHDVGFKKGAKVILRNQKRGYWEGTEVLQNGDKKFTIYLTLNDVLYGTSII